MIILWSIGLIASISMTVFMIFLIKVMSEKYYLRWPEESFAIVGLYVLGVLPCILLIFACIERIINYL